MWGHTVRQLTYYRCSPKPDHHGHLPWFSTRPAHVTVREDDIMPLVNQFFERRIFGEARAGFLATKLRSQQPRRFGHRKTMASGHSGRPASAELGLA
jgi:hypothetical protein